MEQVKKLADAAGVEVPVTLTVSNVGEPAGQVDAAVTRAKRVAARGLKIRDISLEPDSGMKADLDSIARAATDAFKTDNVAGFIQILGKAESTLGRNARAVNYLSDQAAKYSEVSGMNVTTTGDLVGVMEDLTAGSSGGAAKRRGICSNAYGPLRRRWTAAHPKNLAAAAAMETAGMKAQDYGDKVKGAGDAAAGAAGGVDGLRWRARRTGAEGEGGRGRLQVPGLDTLRGNRSDVRGRRRLPDPTRKPTTTSSPRTPSSTRPSPNTTRQPGSDRRPGEPRRGAHACREVAQDVMVAAQEMQYAIEHNTMSVDGAKQMLVEWASQGLISAATAEQLAAEFDAAAVKAQAQADSTNASHGALKNLDGTTAATKVTMDTSDFDAGMRGSCRRSSRADGSAPSCSAAANRRAAAKHRRVAVPGPADTRRRARPGARHPRRPSARLGHPCGPDPRHAHPGPSGGHVRSGRARTGTAGRPRCGRREVHHRSARHPADHGRLPRPHHRRQAIDAGGAGPGREAR